MSSGKRALARWADRGAIVVAAVAAVALALTVLVARDELRGASEATARGEGEALIERIHEGTDPRNGPPTKPMLDGLLSRLRGAGLRAIEVHLGGEVLRAGEPTISSEGLRPGAVRTRGDLALLVTPLPRPPPRPPIGPHPPPDRDPDRDRDRDPDRAPPPLPSLSQDAAAPSLLIIEFAPAELPRLQAAMDRTLVVGSVAVCVLLAFAAALTVRAVRRTRDERRAEQERRLVALGQMSSVMAHELRNPLTSLKGNAQLLAEMLGPGTREHAKAELVVREAQRLERLTQDLLAFVRDGELSRARVTPSALLERALGDLPRERVTLDVSGAPPALWVDEARLATALGNLIRNALQAKDDAGVEVRIRASEDAKDALLVEVQDHGPGIPAGDEERIFEPFFTTRIHGTGLGLAVARRAVEQHGGTLRAASHAGGGAVFRVVLPGAAPPG